jgi:Flp pilus assembly protein TadG
MITSSVKPAQPDARRRAMDTKPVVPARRSRRRRGSALVELTLIAPWLLFLFVGVVDVGFFTYSLIAIENAARIAAEYTSKNLALAGNTDAACTKARAELEMLPGVASLANCSNSTLTVTAASVNGPDLKPATSVSVTYRGVTLIPIPGLLRGRLSFTRNVQMRVKP